MTTLLPLYHDKSISVENVYLVDLVEKMDNVTRIHRINGIHRVLAYKIIQKQGPLTHQEIRFLRTELGLTPAQFVENLTEVASTGVPHLTKDMTRSWLEAQKCPLTKNIVKAINVELNISVCLMVAEKLFKEINDLVGSILTAQAKDAPEEPIKYTISPKDIDDLENIIAKNGLSR